MRRSAAALGAIAAASALAACSPAPGPDVLALYEGGAVTRSELDRRILARPVEERRPSDGDFPSWYQELVRQQAVDEILLVEAQAGALENDPEFAATWAAARRQLLAAALLQRHRPDAAGASPVTEDELRAFFAEHRDEFVQPARREVLHAYLRRGDGETSAALRERAGALRRRVAAGESFESVARRFSDSESRHLGGALGWIERRDLDPEAAAVVFGLAEGELSEPVLTPDGAHLFLVRQAVAERAYALEEVRDGIVRRVQAQRLAALVEELVAEVEVPADTFVPTEAELQALLAADEDALALRVGEVSVTVGELRQRLQAGQREGRPPDPAAVIAAIDQRARLELLAEREGLSREAEVAERLDALHESVLLEAQRRRRLLDWVGADEELVASHYQANASRFSTPLRLELEVLVVPEGSDPNARMAALEASRARLDAGETSLEQLAERWGGSIRPAAWVSMPELRAASPKLAGLASVLPAGRHTPPFVDAGGQLELARVTARQEPLPEALAAVRDRVVEHLVQTRGAELYERMLDEMLGRASYRSLPDRIAALPAGATAGGDAGTS